MFSIAVHPSNLQLDTIGMLREIVFNNCAVRELTK